MALASQTAAGKQDTGATASKPGRESERITLSGCIIAALESNPDMNVSMTDVMICRENEKETMAAVIPEIWTDTGISASGYGMSADISAGLVYRIPGAGWVNSLRRAEKEREIAEEKAKATALELCIEVTGTFFRLLVAERISEMAVQSLESIREQCFRTEEMVRIGIQQYGALLEIRAQLAYEETETAKAMNAAARERTGLSMLLDTVIGEETEAVYPSGDSWLSSCLESGNPWTAFPFPEISGYMSSSGGSLQTFPEIPLPELIASCMPEVRCSELVHELAGIMADGSWVSVMPYVTVRATAGKRFRKESWSGWNGEGTDATATVTLNIPVTGWAKAGISARKHALMKKKTYYEARSEKGRATAYIRNLLNERDYGRMILKAAAENLRTAEEAFRHTESRFENGLADGYEYVTARNTLLEAKASYLQAGYSCFMMEELLYFHIYCPNLTKLW